MLLFLWTRVALSNSVPSVLQKQGLGEEFTCLSINVLDHFYPAAIHLPITDCPVLTFIFVLDSPSCLAGTD
jgi:hypothetical protein